jgi:hypothetical protein
MAFDEIEPGRWRDVPVEKLPAWQALFDSSTEGLEVSEACPVCGSLSLHRWFNLHKSCPTVEFGRSWVGGGSQWQWCSNCRSYEHSNGLVPDWWNSGLAVPEADLRSDPEPIESARLRS